MWSPKVLLKIYLSVNGKASGYSCRWVGLAKLFTYHFVPVYSIFRIVSVIRASSILDRGARTFEHIFPCVFSRSVSLIIWYLLNVLLVHEATSFRVQLVERRAQGGVVPEKRKCVGGLVAGLPESTNHRERVVGADGVRDSAHGTDERVCFWRALFRIAGRFEKDKQLKKTKAQTAGARKWRKRNR